MTQTIAHYEKLMRRAEETASKFGLSPDKDVLNSRNPSRNEMIQLVESDISNLGELYKNCLFVNRVWQALKLTSLNTGKVTIGYAKYNGENEFYHTKKYLKDELAHPGKGGIKVHVWLTFPDGVIFDPSFMVMVHKENGVDLNTITVGQTMIYDQVGIPALEQSMEYFPTLVGSDFLLKAGAIKECSTGAFNHGIESADRCYIEALQAGHPAKLAPMIEHYKAAHPDEWPHIVKGFTFGMKKYIDQGLVVQYEMKGSTEHTTYIHKDFTHIINGTPSVESVV